MSDGLVARNWYSALALTPEPRVGVVRDRPAAGAAPTTRAQNDASLVSACLDGDRDAFETLVERHRRSVYQVCYRFANNHEDARDLSQEVFVRAWRGLGSFKGQAALSTWLYRIAVNVCLNRVGHRKLETEPLDSDRFEDVNVEDPTTALHRDERAAAVRRAIASLPAKQRLTLILRTYHELSHQEIAKILGSSEGAVKANFFHALANLKKILGSAP
jgi:RNA polymerase sigma-70 factor, ECF subfamily